MQKTSPHPDMIERLAQRRNGFGISFYRGKNDRYTDEKAVRKLLSGQHAAFSKQEHIQSDEHRFIIDIDQ
jgi:hypothetical protein